MGRFLTSKENIALNLIFEWHGESRYNRTPGEYLAIALGLPKLAALHAYVNQRLQEIAAAGRAPYLICYFKKGDGHLWFERFPESLSMTTVRNALGKSGKAELMRNP
jgi:hypothetical protein